ncbi:MAG: DNA double-strand break repair nuclease NurA, partial [Staphylothermus sp.]|nr:DNA double-strand break repair nuclease NurA [Staphylothermus sp.]
IQNGYNIMKDLLTAFKKLYEESINSNVFNRTETSRSRKPFDELEYTEMNILETKEFEIKSYSLDELKNEFNELRKINILGLDSSSRVIDTPYIFIGVGSAFIISRTKGALIKCPDFSNFILSPKKNTEFCKFLSIVPEVEGLRSFVEENFAEVAYLKNPNGIPYDQFYNKYAVLDELRTRLENEVLKLLVKGYTLNDSLLFLDGPLYFIPADFYQYINKRTNNTNNRIYVNSWITLMKEKTKIIKQAYEKRIPIIGIVKRIYRSTLLSKTDPFNICDKKSFINDEAYLSIIIHKYFKMNRPKIIVLGPIKYTVPNPDILNLPEKTVYYLCIPRRIFTESNYQNYMFFRIEYFPDKRLYELTDPVKIVLYDSVGMGTLLPLTILIVDRIVKKMTLGVTSYILRAMNIPSEQTLHYINL